MRLTRAVFYSVCALYVKKIGINENQWSQSENKFLTRENIRYSGFGNMMETDGWMDGWMDGWRAV